jgi:hypothetical protein
MPKPTSSALTESAQPTGLPQQILEVPEPTWRKIASALKIKTRQEAVQLVQADESAATLVSQIIATATQAKSALTETPTAEPIADRLYGGGGKARLKIG